MGTAEEPHPRSRRYDPGRRDRIIDACLEVIAEVGVAGASHRRIAAAADVSLGSMSYHFNGIEELLHEAFARFAGAAADHFEASLVGVKDPKAARAVVVDNIVRGVLADPRDLVLTHELYTLAAREPAFRDITHAWMVRSRLVLQRYFDATTARLLDAVIEGTMLHRALDTDHHDVGPEAIAEITLAVDRITRR